MEKIIQIKAASRLKQNFNRVTAGIKGQKVEQIIDKAFTNAEFDEDLDGRIGDNDMVSKGTFYTSTSQVEMRQLDELNRAGLKVTGIAVSKGGKRLAISFTC